MKKRAVKQKKDNVTNACFILFGASAQLKLIPTHNSNWCTPSQFQPHFQLTTILLGAHPYAHPQCERKIPVPWESEEKPENEKQM